MQKIGALHQGGWQICHYSESIFILYYQSWIRHGGRFNLSITVTKSIKKIIIIKRCSGYLCSDVCLSFCSINTGQTIEHRVMEFWYGILFIINLWKILLLSYCLFLFVYFEYYHLKISIICKSDFSISGDSIRMQCWLK